MELLFREESQFHKLILTVKEDLDKPTIIQ